MRAYNHFTHTYTHTRTHTEHYHRRNQPLSAPWAASTTTTTNITFNYSPKNEGFRHMRTHRISLLLLLLLYRSSSGCDAHGVLEHTQKYDETINEELKIHTCRSDIKTRAPVVQGHAEGVQNRDRHASTAGRITTKSRPIKCPD